MSMVEGEQGKYRNLRLYSQDSPFEDGKVDHLVSTEEEWILWVKQATGLLETRFGGEANPWMCRMLQYVREGWISQEGFTRIVEDVLNKVREDGR